MTFFLTRVQVVAHDSKKVREQQHYSIEKVTARESYGHCFFHLYCSQKNKKKLGKLQVKPRTIIYIIKVFFTKFLSNFTKNLFQAEIRFVIFCCSVVACR